MSTKTKQSVMDNNPFGALDMINGQVIIQGATATPIAQAVKEEEVKKTSSSKKATKTVKPVAKPAEAPAETTGAVDQETKSESFEEVVKGMIEREAAIEAAEAALKEKEERLAKAEALLKQAANEQLKQEEKKMAEQENKNNTANELSDTDKELMAQFRKNFDNIKVTQEVKTEDYWTTAKKSFVTGAAAAGGALTVIGLVKLASCLLGGGSSD